MAEVFDIKNHKIINQVSGVALANYIEPKKTLIAEAAASGFFNPIADQLAVGSVIIALSGFMDILIKMANSLVPDEWDKDGNPTQTAWIDNIKYRCVCIPVNKDSNKNSLIPIDDGQLPF